eukprot:SAG31_NODE_2398_length_5781_cov_6.178061_6_plen_95_part_00
MDGTEALPQAKGVRVLVPVPEVLGVPEPNVVPNMIAGESFPAALENNFQPRLLLHAGLAYAGLKAIGLSAARVRLSCRPTLRRCANAMVFAPRS